MSKRSKLKEQARNIDVATAKPLGGDDLRPKDFVAILRIGYELPSYLWTDQTALPPDQPVRLELIPDEAMNVYRVQQICLPFVLVKHPSGVKQMLDIRRHRLARLDPQFGQQAYRAARKSKSGFHHH